MQQPPRPPGQGGPGAPQKLLPVHPPGAMQGQAPAPRPGHQLPQQQNQRPPPRPFQQPHLQAATGSSVPSLQMPRPTGFSAHSGTPAMGGGVPRPIQQPQPPGVQHGMFRSGSPVASPDMFRPGQQYSQLPLSQAASPDLASKPTGGADVLPPRSRSAGERQVVPPSPGQHPSWTMGGAPSQTAGLPGQDSRTAGPGMTPLLPRLGTASGTPWQGTPPTSRPMSAQAMSHNTYANVSGGPGSAPSVDQATAQFGAMTMGNLSVRGICQIFR
ncbi:MAG: hypothetical protein BJ554DRAFT_1069 [Olpidium bornovanus]|uniref:Uncharacterized protein n=1 Tax=Olpidium bornovanus TaxID=278681 RepID=A0A8H7ZSG8_9FUNG|nr:MAG: hypothetical protein BJ554DRAFT_1069 [Olpidium bornovanus]